MKLDQEHVVELVKNIEKMLTDSDVDYPDALAAGLYICSVSAFNMGMNKDIYLKNCETMYDHNRKESLRDLQ